jgi:hypothetical protein
MRIYFLQHPDKHYKNTNLRNWEEGSKPHKDSSRGAAESLWGATARELRGAVDNDSYRDWEYQIYPKKYAANIAFALILTLL